MKRMEALKLRNLFLKLRAQNPNLSIREYARLLNVSHTTVRRWLKESKEPKTKKTDRLEILYQRMPQNLRDRIREYLLYTKMEKTRSRAVPKAKIYDLFELDLKMLGIKDKKEGVRFISHFVKREFGSWEELEQKRRPKKEKPRYRTPKGKLERFIGLMEIDATGYTHEDGTQVFVFLAQDVYTGYLFDEFVIAVRKKDGPKHYNRAFNSRLLAKYFIHLFTTYGLPERIRIDGDLTINNDYIRNALHLLNIKLEVVRLPNQKLIERTIGEVKNWIRSYREVEEIQQRIASARESYNRSEHRYEHFKDPVIPQELLPLIYEHYTQEDENKIRRAFMEKEMRTVHNNTIRWDGYVYSFVYPAVLREGEYGRKPEAPKVLVMRHVDNASYLEVYHPRTKEFLGYAQLYSQDVPTVDPTERKEIKDRERREKKREKKLYKEMEEIRREERERKPIKRLSYSVKDPYEEVEV